MGAASAHCCNVSTPAKDLSRNFRTLQHIPAGSSSKAAFKVRTAKDFKSSYTEKGPLRKGCKVTKAVSTDLGLAYACRKLPRNEMPCQDLGAIAKHFQAVSSLEHPHICRFMEVFEDKTSIHMIYELANPVTLFEHIRERGSLTEEEAADYLRQAAMALSVAHSHGIIHGRLSPRSLILSHDDADFDEDVETQLKICNIGQTWVVRPGILDVEESAASLELESYAVSPELALGELLPAAAASAVPRGSEKNDIWALGVVFYHMLSGTTPFKVERRADLISNVSNKGVRFQEAMWSKLSPDARDIVSSMLRVNASIRISAAHILKHPFVKIAKASFPRTRMVQLLNNVKDNVKESEFKRFVMRVIAEQLPRDSKTADTVEQAFRCLDRNGDGVLTVEEIIKGLRKHCKMKEEDGELERLFAEIDRDSSGTVNVDEFISVSMDQKKTTSLPVLWSAFNAFDNDRSGNITLDEIDKIVKELEGVRLSKCMADALAAEIRRELEAVGTSRSIDFDQFVYIMTNSKPNGQDAIRKDMYRALWGCGVDCYHVRHLEPTRDWNLRNSPVTGRSVYRHKGSHRKLPSQQQPVTAG